MKLTAVIMGLFMSASISLADGNSNEDGRTCSVKNCMGTPSACSVTCSETHEPVCKCNNSAGDEEKAKCYCKPK